MNYFTDQHIPMEISNPRGTYVDHAGEQWREFVCCNECDSIIESVIGWNRIVNRGNFKGRICPGCGQTCMKEHVNVRWESVDF